MRPDPSKGHPILGCAFGTPQLFAGTVSQFQGDRSVHGIGVRDGIDDEGICWAAAGGVRRRAHTCLLPQAVLVAVMHQANGQAVAASLRSRKQGNVKVEAPIHGADRLVASCGTRVRRNS